jgi:formate dehydrogenase subunit gamma
MATTFTDLWKLVAAAVVALHLGLAATPAFAQAGDAGAEAGPVETEQGGATLREGTPNPAITSPDQVELYVPYDDKLVGRVSIPDQKLATLVQPEGRLWRGFRTVGLFWTGILAIGAMLLLLAGFFLWRGRIRIAAGRSGRWVPRFGFVERVAHWTAATSFILLALTGLVVTFGRWALIPLIGHDAFTALTEAGKYVHNFLGTPFILAVVVMLFAWIRDNIPDRSDWDWIRHGGGLAKGSSYHPESGRFNAGQKGIFWAVVLGGIAMAVTGYMMLTPFAVTGVGGMQIAHVIHALLAMVLTAIILAHIYIGTVGMEGAFDAMGRGEVDENWAREHHRGWFEARIRGRSKEGPLSPAPGE